MSGFGAGQQLSLGDLRLASELQELRRAHEAELRAILFTWAELADDVGRFCDDPAAQIPVDLRAGLRLLRSKIWQRLADHGAVPITATAGAPLDPSFHQVIEACDGPGSPGTIVRQLRPGYLWKDKLLRPAEVVAVATRTPAAPAPLTDPTSGDSQP